MREEGERGPTPARSEGSARGWDRRVRSGTIAGTGRDGHALTGAAAGSGSARTVRAAGDARGHAVVPVRGHGHHRGWKSASRHWSGEGLLCSTGPRRSLVRGGVGHRHHGSRWRMKLCAPASGRPTARSAAVGGARGREPSTVGAAVRPMGDGSGSGRDRSSGAGSDRAHPVTVPAGALRGVPGCFRRASMRCRAGSGGGPPPTRWSWAVRHTEHGARR